MIVAAPVSDPHAPLATPRKLTAAEEVKLQLARDYPPGALGWVDDLTWAAGPQTVPLSQIDRAGPDWELAARNRRKIAEMIARVRAGARKPVVLVRYPGSAKLFAVDGHSRLLSDIALGLPATAWVGTSKTATGDWRTVHGRQHAGSADR